MSAFLVSPDTVRLLAIEATARFRGGWDIDAAQRAARVLWEANCASLRDRYGETEFPECPTLTSDDAFRLLPLSRQPALVIKQAHCYAYQSCEWRDWDSSEAKRICRAAENEASRKIPGYDAAPWGLP